MYRFAERRIVAVAVAVATALLFGACGGSSSKSSAAPQNPAANQLQATVASFDLTPEAPRRFLVGLATGDGRLIGFGTVQVRVRRTDPPGAAAGQPRDASFLPIPATQVPNPVPTKPTLVDTVRGRGVYAATIGFDEPGIWTADVDAEVEGLGRLHASTEFQVATEHEAIAVGDRAPVSNNYTIANHDDAALRAVDSRAQTGTTVPDPELHRATIAGVVAARRPLVVVFSTPVYCQSRFCGPITDMVAEVAKEYAGKAAFVHVEIFKDFDKQIVNDAALQWLQRVPGGEIHEPWVYVVGSDGTVRDRFDNVITRDELIAAIRRL